MYGKTCNGKFITGPYWNDESHDLSQIEKEILSVKDEQIR